MIGRLPGLIGPRLDFDGGLDNPINQTGQMFLRQVAKRIITKKRRSKRRIGSERQLIPRSSKFAVEFDERGRHTSQKPSVNE
jgi:hypothetical protein